MAKLTVYICREQEHEKLVEMVKDVLRGVKGKKPKIHVVRLKLERGEDFPIYLSQLEEMFGGIATAEFRKYKIESLPAIVYNDQLILQGSIPSLEELEEALAYAGLKFSRERPRAQPLVQLQPLQQSQAGKQASVAPQLETVKTDEEVSVRKTPQPPPKIKILERLSQPVEEERREAKAEQKVEAIAPQVRKQEEAAKPAPQVPPHRVSQPQQRPTQPKLEPHDIIRREEILVNVPQTEPSRTTPRAKKTCGGCIFYDSAIRRCLLLRAPISDPSSPICA